MKFGRRIFAGLLLTVALLFVSGADAATVYVKQDGTGDGSSWANASGSLREGAAGDEVWVAAGVYSPGMLSTDVFLLNKGVKIYGGFPAMGSPDMSSRDWTSNVTTLDGNYVNIHVVRGAPDATSDDTRIDGFTITRGRARLSGGYGGGMYNSSNSSPTVANCTFSNNRGGGMRNEGDGVSPTVTNCTFSNNNGGMSNYFGSSPTITNCTFSGNTATDESGGGIYDGGGIFNWGASPTITNCTFSGNTAINYGGGIYNIDSTTTITNCTFSGNTITHSQGSGGGIFAYAYYDDSLLTVTNCTFSGNTASEGGGILGMSYGTISSLAVTVTNCTFSDNKATYGGGMAYGYGDGSSTTVTNTILWGNTATSGDAILQSYGTLTLNSNVLAPDGVHSDFGSIISNDIIYADPLLVPLDKSGNPATASTDVYIYGLRIGSSAIDRGLPVGTVISGDIVVPSADQRGVPRPQHFGVDIGAYEYGEVPVTGVTLNKTSTSLAVNATETLTATVAPSNATNKAVTWSTTNTSIASVDQTGLVKANGGGKATIIVSSDAYPNIAASCEITVIVPVTGISIDKKTMNLTVGSTDVLSVDVRPTNATDKTVTWTSSNTSVATVSADSATTARITAVAAGTTVISAKTNDGGFSADCTITVPAVLVTGITLDPTTATIVVNATRQLTATVAPANATNKAVTWSSGNAIVATVSSGGVVTALTVGTAVITAKSVADATISADCTVTVTPILVTGVTLDKNSIAIKVGKTGPLTATIAPTNATNKAVTWSSSNPNVAEVSNGTVTGKAAGGATITVTTSDGGKTAICAVTITADDPKPEPPIKPEPVQPPKDVEDKIPEAIKEQTQIPTPKVMEDATDAGKIDESIKDNKDLKDAMDTLTETAMNGKKYPKLDEVKKHVDEDINKDTMQQLESFALTLEGGKSFLVVTNALRLSFDVTFDKIVIVKILADKKTKPLTMKFDGVLEKDGDFTIVRSADQTKIVTAAEKPIKGEDYIVSWMIKDNSDCDLDKTPGKILDPAVIAEKTAVNPKDPKGGGGGCSAAYLPFALLLAIPLFFRRKR